MERWSVSNSTLELNEGFFLWLKEWLLLFTLAGLRHHGGT